MDTIRYHTCLAQDTLRESDKNTRKHHIQFSQEVGPFPTGNLKTAKKQQQKKKQTWQYDKDKYKNQIRSTSDASPWNSQLEKFWRA